MSQSSSSFAVGDGTFQIDALEAIDAWVESGKAPERLVASRPLAGAPGAQGPFVLSAGRALSWPGQHGRGEQLRLLVAITYDADG